MREAIGRSLRVPANLALAAIALFLLAAAVSVPVDRKGDGSEYILATESLYYDHDLVIDNTVDIFRHIDIRPQWMDTPAGLTRMQGTDGVERYGLHSFYYPVLCLPFYAAFGYHGFYILNALLIVVIIAAVYAHLGRTQPRGRALALAAGGVFLSAAWSYVFWTQTEPFYTALIALHLYFWHANRPLRGAACMGIALGAQLPLALLGVPLLVESLVKRRLKTALLVAGIYLLCAAPQLAYDVHYLGTVAPMMRMGLASTRYVSLGTWFRMIFDPAMGLVWFYPVALYCLVRWRPTWRSASLLLATGLVLLAMTSVYNVYSHQVGARYACYALPVLFFCVEDVGLDGVWSRLTAASTVVIGAGLAINPVDNSRDMDLRHKTFLPYRIAAALGLSNENPEVFRASSDEIVPGRVYARRVTRDHWTWGDERAELMLVGVEPGILDLDLRAYATLYAEGPDQRLRIETMSGAKVERSLPAKEVTRVSVRLDPADVHEYVRWAKTYTYVTIWADSWSPAITMEGHPPEAHDIRRLGVNIVRIALGGETLLEQ
ncbi:MAG TPA: hypothetical protein VGL81_29290 [Polyangiaceae bacterium]|jgi:hypothetical protein